MEQIEESKEKVRKEKKPWVVREKAEKGGDKRWVIVVLIVTVFLSLVFYLLSGRLEFGMPAVSGVDFSGIQEARYSY